MKIYFIILTLIISSECGVLDDILSPKEKPQGLNDLLNLKPKNPPESSKAEHREGVIIKVVETLKNGTKIVIDALGNIIHIHPNENNEDTKIKDTVESTTKTLKADGVENNIDASKSKNPKIESSTEKVKETQTNFTEATNQTATQIEKDTPKLDENLNTTPTAEVKKKVEGDTEITTKDTVQVITETPKIDDHNLDNKNCTASDTKSCGNTTMEVHRRTFLKGDKCPKGKDKADDGTCVDEV